MKVEAAKEALLLRLQSHAERVACWMLCAGAAVALQNAIPSLGQSAPPAGNGRVQTAYFEGRAVDFRTAPPAPGQRALKLGPWRFGDHTVHATPRDKRPNLYLVAPSGSDPLAGKAVAATAVINTVPLDNAVVDWDVYWVLVLDPQAQQDFRSERELLVTAQNEFQPEQGFAFGDIPSAAFLRRYLKIDSLAGLDKYRRRSGNLPQLVIVPAGFTVRAAAEAPEAADSQ